MPHFRLKSVNFTKKQVITQATLFFIFNNIFQSFEHKRD